MKKSEIVFGRFVEILFFSSSNIQSFSSSLKVCQKCGNYDTTFGMNSLKGFAGALGTTSLSLMGKLLEINTFLVRFYKDKFNAFLQNHK